MTVQANPNLENMRVPDRVKEGPDPGDNLRNSANLVSPEANAAIKAMSGDSKMPAAFAGKDGNDATIVDGSKAAPASDMSKHTVSGEKYVETIVGNDTRYSTSAEGIDAERAKQLANQQANGIERV